MNPKRITTPTEPVTLDEAKLHLRVDDTDEDALIQGLISAARETCEDRTEGTVPVTGWRLTLDTFPDAIKLPRPPIVSVESVRYLDTAGVQQTLSPMDYVVDTVSSPGYIVPAFGKAWPETRDQINAVEVEYTAGSATPPPAVQAWMLLAIGEMFATREASAERPAVAHGFADRLLDPFRVWGV
jgi:uncharacterized phiE125 gp8 family phage protein